MPPRHRARHVAYLPQMRSLAWPMRVRDVVALGRYAYGAPISKLRAEDDAAVTTAMSAAHLNELRDRRADTLSGGEAARMHIARALASEAPFLIADEPTNSLDPRHQLRVMNMFRRHADNIGGAIVVMHDLTLAARFADRLVWMKNGAIVADGPLRETLTEERVADVFGVRCDVSQSADGVSISLRDVMDA